MVSLIGDMHDSNLLVVASMLLWVAIVPQALVMASPLIPVKQSQLTSAMTLSGSPAESKLETLSSSDNGSDEGMTTILEALTKLVSGSQQPRLINLNLEQLNPELISRTINGKHEENGLDNIHLYIPYSDYTRSKYIKFPQVASTAKRAAAMGVDLPDYILHMNKGRNFDFSSFREKMQKSG